MPPSRVRVVVLQPGLGALDYALPDGMALVPGDIVSVPLGPRHILGVVWDADLQTDREIEASRLRVVAAKADVPPLTPPLRRLCEWVASYYLAPLSAVVRMVLASPSALEPGRSVIEYRAGGPVPARLTPAREAALAALGDRRGKARDLARIAGVSEGVVRGLITAGTLVAESVPADADPVCPDPDFAPPRLEAAQSDAAATLVAAVAARTFHTFVLDGVTGSGKTEVYFEAIAAALRDGGQALVLLPEIALTAPWLARFQARFGCTPVAWHSDLRSSQRRAAWRAVATGKARVVVGARSALFLPFADLRVTIVDEAHETSFKQEEGVHYHARDVAVMRGQAEGATVVLATATPAIETQVQVERGTYKALHLPARFAGAQMPDLRTIDLRRHPPARGSWISPPLAAALTATLDNGEQTLLFLNRRGYAPLTLCRACGERIECPNCSAWMVEHRLLRRLACHHCGHQTAPPDACPACGAAGMLVASGPGVERIAEEVARSWPAARVAVVTSDTITSPPRAAALVGSVERREIDVLIGTQMVTKGYHFPDLTLVGVVDGDLGLAGGDLRAAERTFQQIAQVAGRAGRGTKPGQVLIQTHQPDARIMKALVSGDSAAFYAAETEARRDLALPPFGRLAALVVSSEDAEAAAAHARALGRAAPSGEGLSVLGPASAPLAMLRGRYRYRLLVQARRTVAVQRAVADWLAAVPAPAGVRVVVDIDPYSFV